MLDNDQLKNITWSSQKSLNPIIVPDGTPILCEGYAGPDNEQGSCMKFNMAKDTWGVYSTAPKKR